MLKTLKSCGVLQVRDIGVNLGLSGFTSTPFERNAEDALFCLPRSAFLDQAHIRTICAHVQFAAKNCPKAAIYGYVDFEAVSRIDSQRGGIRATFTKLPDAPI
jgi:hypothetical protein